MSDNSIYDDRTEFKNSISITRELKSNYERLVVTGADKNNVSVSTYHIDDIKITHKLFVNWPGDDIVQKIIRDTCKLLAKYDINPDEVK